MQKIVTHPLYIRCQKVINSCNTPKQIEMAKKYCDRASKKISGEFYKKQHTLWQISNFEFSLMDYFKELYNRAHKKKKELEWN